MASYNSVEIDRRFRGAYCFHHRSIDEGNTQTTGTRLRLAISEKAAIFDNSLSKDIIAKNTFFAVTVAKKLKRVVCDVKVVLSV
jgi:hypothetical protein